MAPVAPKHEDPTETDITEEVTETPEHPDETAEDTDTNADVPSVSPTLREQIKYNPDGTQARTGGAYIDSDPNLPAAQTE